MVPVCVDVDFNRYTVAWISPGFTYAEVVMGQTKIDKLLDSLHKLQSQIEAEVRILLEQKQAEFKYNLLKGKVKFESEIKKLHKAQRVNVFVYIITARLGHILTAPVIYSLIFPIFILDVSISIYQSICFRIYAIPLVRRSDYIQIDRHKLAYLNIIEKLNCIYCGYGNGVIEYAREITSITEQYWCPIKHARRVRATHELTNNFLDYGDADAYHQRLDEIRTQLTGQGNTD